MLALSGGPDGTGLPGFYSLLLCAGLRMCVAMWCWLEVDQWQTNQQREEMQTRDGKGKQLI